jgi:hypothetical protein
MHISHYKQSSEESFVQESDVPLKVLLRFFQNPFLKVDKVERVRILYFLGFNPFNKEWKMIGYLFSVENSVDHVATEQPHFYFVTGMGINASVLVDGLEDVRGGRPIRKF